MENISISTVEEALSKATLLPSQNMIFLLRIEIYLRKLRNGEKPPAIKVDNNIIVEGHHRYVAGLLFGQLPDVVPGTFSISGVIYKWENVTIDMLDYGGE
jgi:hypothetical protein